MGVVVIMGHGRLSLWMGKYRHIHKGLSMVAAFTFGHRFRTIKETIFDKGVHMTDYFDLGLYRRRVSTKSQEAQLWFDRGLLWCFGYNHDESVACFERAVKADPDLAIAYWGIAYASGCNYNKPWEAFDEDDALRSVTRAFEATQNALAKIDQASEAEAALIRALKHRYPSAVPAGDMNTWNDDFANAMREVYRAYPDDHDVVTLFCEAIMNRTPWALWDLKTGNVADGADTEEAVEVLERALAQDGAMQHPGLLHIYVHLMEMSPHPERALKAGDALRGLVPDAGHLNHMPTHIDVLCGHYERVVASNEAAIVADRKFLAREGALNFYSLYRCHDYHFKIYGAMFMGRYKDAIETSDEMVATLPEDLLTIESPPMADWLEGFISMKQHVYIRFGKWQEIIDQPLPENTKLFCVTTAMMHYAKAVAWAASGHVEQAEKEAILFEAAVKRVPDSRYVFNNTCLDILAVAREMMLGEIEYRRANYDAAYAHLRKSVEMDDNLPYDEPWGWMQPTRHALAALLLEQGHVEESAAVYRADLGLDNTLSRACQHPDNVWSLHGYHDCLTQLGRNEEATYIKQRLDLANARTDVAVKSSCFCKLGSV
jgi:tetratricopeptide (TPR) repeat protein